ncbi:flavodoxin family protein [Nocardia huaxiensis]|uniref:Flavodoxin family protein n=1 Tax=Nocardia huaxiensis TaxID=2755382 RepID=A0A7D6ZMM9_9NOCA|nr:flavodoxin family protein [Nocardia huaxiensis]QLY33320.1 flavodoxin family protein [Nocardia huaxiensis]UFS99775.1 flavodoxin family protein [Nocardia huaxiensis]
MNAIIVCKSVSHGNTRRVADAMGEVLQAKVVGPEDLDPATLLGYDLVGFGSGVRHQAMYPELRDFVRALPDGQHGRAFVFATSGFSEVPVRPFMKPVVDSLQRKGFDVVDTFRCEGWDTWFPFKPVGGVRKGHPSSDDLAAARAFAAGLRSRLQ